jgi:hypothetical protein
MSSSIYVYKGKQYRRFVEIYPGNVGYYGVIMVFPLEVNYDMLARGFQAKELDGYFRAHCRKCGIMHKSVTFKPINRMMSGEYMKKLLNYLDEKMLNIRWKEGQYGYEIDKLGNILRDWPLTSDAPAKIVEAEVIETADKAADAMAEETSID